MCRLSEPAEGQTVIDPMCGAGTILIERNRLVRPGLLVGGDLFPDPLHAARRNLSAEATPGRLAQWDARRLPLGDQSVDRVISNLPWGRRIGSHRTNRRLDQRILRQVTAFLSHYMGLESQGFNGLDVFIAGF
jgi:23S rRNA G2445 N2-methylase RlmL